MSLPNSRLAPIAQQKPTLTGPYPLCLSDRYVLVGNHRDAWILGSIDPSSGTAALLELSRVLAGLRRETGESCRPVGAEPGAGRPQEGDG